MSTNPSLLRSGGIEREELGLVNSIANMFSDKMTENTIHKTKRTRFSDRDIIFMDNAVLSLQTVVLFNRNALKDTLTFFQTYLSG